MRSIWRIDVCLRALFIIGCLGLAADLRANEIYVENTVDETTVITLRSLREAWENAINDNAAHSDREAGAVGGGALVLPSGATITLTAPLSVDSELLIVGNGSTITKTGGLLFATTGSIGTLTLRNLTLDGDAGICISAVTGNQDYVLDRVTLFNCWLGVAGSATAGVDEYIDVLLVNSTIDGNDVADALGISVTGDGFTVNIVNSTITRNKIGVSAPTGPKISIANSLLAGNDMNCSNSSATLSGVNLSDDATCGPASANLLVVANALIGPLDDNGGPTKTHALLSGSPAIDTADDAICAADPVNGIDQRGSARPFDGDEDGTAHCDIGAFELLIAPRAGCGTH